MATGYNLAEGGSNGVVPDNTNTGGASGDPISSILVSSTDAVVFSTAAAKFGTLGYRFTLGASGTGATRMLWGMSPGNNRHVFSFYWSIDSVPTQVEDVAGMRNATGNMEYLLLGVDGKLVLQNTLGTTIAASRATNAILANTLYRVDLVVKPGTDTVTGTMGYAYYAVATSDTTPVFSYESAVQNTGTAVMSHAFIGRSTGRVQAHVIDYDTIRWDTLASGYLPAYSPPSVAADAGINQADVEPYSTVTLDGANSVGATTYSWTQIAGTTVSLTGASTATPSFKAPGTMLGDTLRFRLTVDGGAIDDVDVVVLLATERIVSGGVLVPCEWRISTADSGVSGVYSNTYANAYS